MVNRCKLFKRQLRFALATTTSSLFFSGGLCAQDTGSAEDLDDLFEIIVVTAQKREQNLDDVPASASVVTERMIDRLGIREVDDFSELMPNVTFVESQLQNVTALVIRGVGQIRNVDAPAAIVIDGVQIVDPLQFNQSLFDIESIEVFRGPQGAYWGRNAIQGAINITTRQPGGELEASMKTRYQSGDDVYVSGLASGPLVEQRVYFKLSGFYQDRGGRIDTTHYKEADHVEKYGVRGNALFTPNERLKIDLLGSYQDTDGGALYWSMVPATLSPDEALGTQSSVDLPGRSQRELTEISVKTSYKFDAFTFLSISAYTDLTDGLFGDGDFGTSPPGAPDVFQNATRDLESFSQEIRLTSPNEGRLRWQLGGYYLTTERHETLDVRGDFDGDGIFEVPFVSGDDNFEQDSWAVFGNIQYDLTNRLTLSTAVRYDEDEFTATPAAGGASRTLAADKLQPLINLKYDMTENTNVYASYAVGFRSGRLNASTVPGGLEVADPETATTYEVGFKSRNRDYGLAINGAAFYTDYENQLEFFGSPTYGQLVINLDETKIWGLELDARFQASDKLEVFAVIGYTDEKIDRFDLVPPPGVLLIDTTSIPGNTVAGIHEVTLNVGGQYRVPFADNRELIFYADYEYLGERQDSLSNNYSSDGFGRTDLRVSLESDNWVWTVFGKNIFDTEFTREFGPFSEQAGVPFNFFIPDEGAIWGSEVRVNF